MSSSSRGLQVNRDRTLGWKQSPAAVVTGPRRLVGHRFHAASNYKDHTAKKNAFHLISFSIWHKKNKWEQSSCRVFMFQHGKIAFPFFAMLCKWIWDLMTSVDIVCIAASVLLSSSCDSSDLWKCAVDRGCVSSCSLPFCKWTTSVIFIFIMSYLSYYLSLSRRI